MRRRLFILSGLGVSLALAAIGFAQEGHPLTGTWTGDWGPSATQRNHVTIVMNWDGSNVTGTINPGPDSVPIASVAVDLTNWTSIRTNVAAGATLSFTDTNAASFNERFYRARQAVP